MRRFSPARPANPGKALEAMHNSKTERSPEKTVMCRHQPIVATLLAVCLTLSASFNPAFGSGMISTERVVAAAPSATPDGRAYEDTVQAQRTALQATLVAAGVDPSHASARLAALTDVEVAELSQQFDSAPAGGLWFMPFLLVAAVIGLLIGTRSAQASDAAPSTDLFGRPRNLATAP